VVFFRSLIYIKVKIMLNINLLIGKYLVIMLKYIYEEIEVDYELFKC